MNSIMKAAAGLMAVVVTLYSKTPDSVREAANAALLLFAIDTVLGVLVAIFLGRLRSYIMRRMAIPKLLQYFGLAGAFGVGSYVLHDLTPIKLVLWFIAAVEFTSIIESCLRLQAAGGVNVGPLQPLVDRLRRAFGIESGLDLDEQWKDNPRLPLPLPPANASASPSTPTLPTTTTGQAPTQPPG